MTTVEARSPKYPALYDPASGVRFIAGRAEVTEEQALALADRRYVDGILIDGTPAKDWAKAHRRDAGGDEPAEDAVMSPESDDMTEQTAVVLPPDNTPDQPVDERRRGTRRNK